MKFGKFTRRESGLVSVREMRSASDNALQSTPERESEERPPPIKRITNASQRSRHLEHGAHLRRYWIRGIIGIFVPIAITVYWFIVWYVYLGPQPPGSPVLYGHSGGRWIFYSWFLIGIFGMNLSKYGLTGVEAGMLMDPRWAARNAMQIMMHAEHSWAGPSGWMKSIKHMFIRGDKRPEPPTPLWTILAFLSILPIVALPLTGLCYELKDGFHPTGNHPNVTGLDWHDINLLAGVGLSAGIWKTGTNATLPGLGVIYTLPGVSRSTPNLDKFPNSLPVDDGVDTVFITQQAEEPISGTAWGLLLSYNCSVVNKVSDFTILNQRRDGFYISDSTESELTADKNWYWPNVTGVNDGQIRVRNDSQDTFGSFALNYFSLLEEGYSMWPPRRVYDDGSWGYADNYTVISGPLARDDCYYWGHPESGEYPKFEQQSVYEAALWQDLVTGLSTNNLKYDTTLDANLTELYAKYNYLLWDGSTRNWSAVGVRCVASSEVGTAEIDGRGSTYTNFQRTDTPIPELDTCMPRLGEFAPALVVDSAIYGDTAISAEWVGNLFRSTNSPVFTTGQTDLRQIGKEFHMNETQINDWINRTNSQNDETEETILQPTYLQAEDLRKSLLRTYPASVIEMLYNGGDDWHGTDGTLQHLSNINPNVTAFVERTLFEKGTILPFWVPGALFLLWTILTIALTLIYGFRRRWSASLDSYSVLRIGADFAESIRNHPEFGINMGFEECYVLRDLPGQIGDANVGFEPGHITLVKGGKETVADKRKMYM